MPIHIAATAGAIVTPAAIGLGALGGAYDWIDALGMLGACYSGYNPVAGVWQPDLAMANYGSIAAGCVASKLAAKTGVNRYLPKGFNI